MSSSIKSIFPLFESVCVKDGFILNEDYHTERFKLSYQNFYWKTPHFNLFNGVKIPAEFQKGKVKLRISYNEDDIKVVLKPYITRNIESLKLVNDNNIDYALKFEERSQLNTLFEQRDSCDDVLIAKNGNITDSTYANIVFLKNSKWYTPNSYLLKGTKRTALLKQGHVEELPITTKNLFEFEGFQLINAMLDFNPNTSIPINKIQL